MAIKLFGLKVWNMLTNENWWQFFSHNETKVEKAAREMNEFMEGTFWFHDCLEVDQQKPEEPQPKSTN